MQNAGYAALQIIPSFEGFQGKLESGSSGALVAAGASGGKRYGDSAGRSMVTSFASHARRAALLGGAILTGAGYAAFQFGKGALAEAEEAQKVGALTAQVIKTTGQAANLTADQVGRLSEALSNKTGVDDEVIQRGANMLLTFKNIRNEVGAGNDIFSQSLAVTEDMAAAMAGGTGGGQLDLKSSSILVGKALNDPVKGLTALTRVGVSFTDQQKKNIESLVEQNKQSEAQKIILGELQSEFGGAARAQATLGEKVDVAWGNIQERIGTALLPLIHDVQRAFLREGVPALERFSDWFQSDGIPAVQDFISEARPLANEVLPAASSALGDVRDIAKDALPIVKNLIEAFNDMPDWAKKGLVVGGLGAYAASKTGIIGKGASIGSSILGGFSKATPLPVYVVNNGVDLPGGPKTKVPGKLSSAAALGPQAAALALTGYVAYQTGKTVLPGIKQSAATTALPAGGPSMGSGSSDWASAFPKSASADQAGEALWRASLADDWAEVLRLAQDYNDVLGTTMKSGQQLQGVTHKFSREFGVGLEDANRVLGGKLPASADQLRDRIGRASDSQTRLTRNILGSKAVGDELLNTFGLIAKPWRADVNVDTGDSEARLNRILILMNTIAHRGGLQQAGALPGDPSSGKVATGGPRGRAATGDVYLDGEKVGAVMDRRIDSRDELVSEQRRAGRR